MFCLFFFIFVRIITTIVLLIVIDIIIVKIKIKYLNFLLPKKIHLILKKCRLKKFNLNVLLFHQGIL